MLTQQEQDDLLYVLSLAEDDEERELDLSDERQYRVAVAMQNLAGHTPETRPGMHAALAELRERHIAYGGPAPAPADPPPLENMFLSGARVSDIGLVTGTQDPAATGFVGFVSGAWQVNASIAVVDTVRGTQLAAGGATQIGLGEYLPLTASPEPGARAVPAMTGSIFYMSQERQGGEWTSRFVKRNLTTGIASDPVVIHPNQHQTRVRINAIRIALGRGQNQQDDVDYWYWYGTPRTDYAIPFVGSVELTLPPRLPLTENVRVYGTLARRSTSRQGGYKELPDDQKLKLLNSLRASGNTLLWTLAPPADRPPWGSMGEPLNWGPLSWATGEIDYVTVQLIIRLVGQEEPIAATIQSSDTPDDDEQVDGTRNILPLQFLWSCLAAGTPVTLADGTTIPIEEVVRGTVVRCGDGEAREVQQTVQFPHDGEVLRLATDDGSRLVLSTNHPVATPTGIVTAGALAVGATVNVAGGTATVTEAELGRYEGILCNLSLSLGGEPDPAASTFYAAGVEVGDYELQVTNELAYRIDPDRILAELEPRYHPDFQNYLASLKQPA
jgi:hypothetical protein